MKETINTKTNVRDEAFFQKLEAENFDEAKTVRPSRIEKQWMINYAFYKGWHNMQYDSVRKTLVFTDSDPFKFYVNYVFKNVSTIRSVVTRDLPRWDVDAIPYGKLEPDEAMVVGQFIGQLFDKLGIKELGKNIVYHGLLYGLGIFQYGYDPDEDELFVNYCDPFDTYIGGAAATNIDDASYVIKVIKKDIQEVKNNPNYNKNKELLFSDNKESESSWKQAMLTKSFVSSMNFGDSNGSGNRGTVLVHEMWVKLDEKIWVVTTCNGKVLRYEETEYEELPFVLYQPDKTAGELYGEGYVKNLVPLNKLLNYLERRKAEYNALYATGRYKIRGEATNITTISNEHGEIIKEPLNGSIEQMPMYTLPGTMDSQISMLLRYMQDIGSVQDAMMGRAPSGVTSGVAFETLVANNMTSLTDIIDNYASALQVLGQKVLRLAYMKYNTTREVKTSGIHGDSVVKVVGQTQTGVENTEGVVQLPENPVVKVTITSGVAFTKGGKRDLLTQLRARGDIDLITYLEELGLPADQIQYRRMAEQQGLPITDESVAFVEGNAEQQMEQAQIQGAMQQQQTQQAVQEQAMQQMQPQEQAPEMGVRDAIQSLIALAQESGAELDPAIMSNPELALRIIAGEIPVGVSNGILTVLQ